MSLFLRVFIGLFLAFGLAACGGEEGFISAFERTVPVATDDGATADSFSSSINEEQGITETPNSLSAQEASLEGQSEDNSILLYDKVLASSDISEVALNLAFEYYDRNQSIIKNKNWVTIFDIGQHSGERRLYIINMNTGDVRAVHTAHGKKSDLSHDGVATDFSNVNGSNKSSLGFMLTAETYYGKHGYSLRLDGLESRNSNVRRRAIVIHGADYVNPNWSKMGRSLGCPALSWGNRSWVIDAIKGGSLIYTFHEDYDS